MLFAALRTAVHAGIAGLVLLTSTGISARAQMSPTNAPTKASCTIRKTPLLDAEAALSREEYATARDLYAKLAGSDAVTSRTGTILTLIEQGQIAEAEKQARSWLELSPKEAAAAEVLAEVLYRKADLAGSYQLAHKASVLNPCNARAYLLDAKYESMTANFAMSRKHVRLAHQLDPIDPDIRWSWVGTLKQMDRISRYREIVEEDRLLNAKRKAQMLSYLQYANESGKDDCTVTGKVDKATVPIKPILNGPTEVEGLALDVYFNGKRRRLEIDTGAAGLVLSRGAATGLGLVREQKTVAEGVGDKGEVATSTAHVESVKIGNLEFRHCKVQILEKRSALEIDGLIGGNVFSKYLLTLDYPKMQLRLNPLPKRPGEKENTQQSLETSEVRQPGPGEIELDDDGDEIRDRYIAPEMEDWTRVYRVGYDLLIPVAMTNSKQNMFASDKLFIVDTGASSMLISPAAAREVTKVRKDDSVGITGISGEVNKVYSTDQFTFGFARLKQTVNEMTSIDTTKFSHDDGVEISGFLGEPILSRLTVHIDYRDNLMKFEYDPKHDHPGAW